MQQFLTRKKLEQHAGQGGEEVELRRKEEKAEEAANEITEPRDHRQPAAGERAREGATDARRQGRADAHRDAAARVAASAARAAR